MKAFTKNILTPLSIPVGASLLLLVVAFNYSRILLYLEKHHSDAYSSAATILVAAVVLFAGVLFTSGRHRVGGAFPSVGIAALLLLLAGGLTGASGKGGAEAATGAGGALTVSAKEYSFTPNQLTIASGIITVTLENVGTAKHTFVIEGDSDFKKLEAEAGLKDTGKAKLRPGTYTFYCSELGHRGSGMEGKLTVTG